MKKEKGSIHILIFSNNYIDIFVFVSLEKSIL